MSGKTNMGTRTKVCSYRLSYLGKLATQKLVSSLGLSPERVNDWWVVERWSYTVDGNMAR